MIRLPDVLPKGGGGLRIEIEDGHTLAVPFGGDGERHGEGGFPAPALLGEDGQRSHWFTAPAVHAGRNISGYEQIEL